MGGHFEAEESPEDCLLREVREETGYTLTSWQFRGLVTFVSGDGETEYMSLFTADGFTEPRCPAMRTAGMGGQRRCAEVKYLGRR